MTAPKPTPVAAWPEDQPNPFDPAMPAPGTGLKVTGDAGPVDGGAVADDWDQVLIENGQPR